MDAETLLDYVKTNSCSSKFLELEQCLSLFVEKVKTLGLGTSDDYEEVLEILEEWFTVTASCTSKLKEAVSRISPSIAWHPDKKDMLETFYLSGDSPWSFLLTYNRSSEIEDLLKKLESKWRKNLLSKIESPEVGNYVCCCDNKAIFRGIIQNCLSKNWVRVLNIDKCQVSVVKLDSCYVMTKEFAELHADAIQCSLTKEEFNESLWNLDLKGVFQTILRDSRLTVRIIDKIDDAVPPKFLVEMYAFNETSEVETSISHWISSRLLPALKKLDKGDTEKLYEFLDEEVLDPFVCISDISTNAQGSDCEPNEVKTEKKPVDTITPAEEPYESKKTIRVNVQSSPTGLDRKPSNRLAHLLTIEGMSPPKKSVEREKAKQMKTEVSPCKFTFENVIDVPEFKPANNYSKVSSSPELKPRACKVEDLVPVVKNGYNEDAALPANYNPSDDRRICTFYARNGYCWKPGCMKEHTKIVADKWTDDSVGVFKETINKLSLPNIGAKITATVTHVMCANTFYILLPDSFSDDEEECETIGSLISQLNDPVIFKEFKMLDVPPCFGQLLIAYSNKRKQWLRASVFDIYDTNIIQGGMFKVFFVDIGIVEEISFDKCRDILPEHIHLPYQAVYCSLSGLYTETSQDEAGKMFLEKLILDQQLIVDIIDSDVQDTRIEVIAYTKENININDIMIKRGYCSTFQR